MGVLIRSSEHAKDLELCQWMARGFGMAGVHCIVCLPDGQRYSHPGLDAEPFLRANRLVSQIYDSTASNVVPEGMAS